MKYLNTHNGNKLKEAEQGKPVNLLSYGFCLLGLLYILHATFQCLIQFPVWL